MTKLTITSEHAPSDKSTFLKELEDDYFKSFAISLCKYQVQFDSLEGTASIFNYF